jgi:hypothetical protein
MAALAADLGVVRTAVGRAVGRTLTTLLACLATVSCASSRGLTVQQQRASWVAGREASPWRTTLCDNGGRERYALTLQPLWAVEGGIVALEIVLGRPSAPAENVLGEREMNVPQPFVITVEDLERGLEKSPFAANRTFRIPGAPRRTLRVHILESRLGRGRSNCPDCATIEALTADLTVE